MNIAQQILEENDYFQNAQHLVEVEGLSSPKVCNFLNKLVANIPDGEHYLEIGTWKGLTLCSAAYKNPGKICYACDKFRFWGKFTGWGFQAKRTCFSNIEKYTHDGAKVHFFHMTSEQLFAQKKIPAPVKVYFYDGDHTYEGTKQNILSALPLMSQDSILLVDDYKGPDIPRATEDALAEVSDTFTITWQKILSREDEWWNNLGVFALSRNNA